jgi:hypothetical protein
VTHTGRGKVEAESTKSGRGGGDDPSLIGRDPSVRALFNGRRSGDDSEASRLIELDAKVEAESTESGRG